MNRSRDEIAALLRWYPPAWRERYGDELVALMEDYSDEKPPTTKIKLSLIWAGLRERGHESGLLGVQTSPADRTRAGSLLVLCGWMAFVMAGASFSKAAEHFARALPVASRPIPQGAFDVVAALGVIGAILVAIGAIAALPAFIRLLREGGWSPIRQHVLRASMLSVATAAALVLLSAWARHLNAFQRNGGDGLYSVAFVTWALLAAGTLAQLTAAGVAAAHKIHLTRRLLHLEALLAVAVAGAMAVMTVATALWWGTMAKGAPSFLDGTVSGSRLSLLNIQLALTLGLMLAAALVGAYGVGRVARSWTLLRPS